MQLSHFQLVLEFAVIATEYQLKSETMEISWTALVVKQTALAKSTAGTALEAQRLQMTSVLNNVMMGISP